MTANESIFKLTHYQRLSSVASVLPSKASCSACDFLEATEIAVAHEMVRQLRDHPDITSTVCMFHLRSLLAAGPQLDVAKRTILDEARALNRLAEDMQNYVLDHEAIRHHLSTNAECQASITGLAHLVGRRNIVFPWKTE